MIDTIHCLYTTMKTKKIKRSRYSLKTDLYNFLEYPHGFWATTVQGIIIFLIILSVILTLIELFNQQLFTQYQTGIVIADTLILFVFTVEYLLRLLTAPKRIEFVLKPLSIIDFFAIAPNYLEFVLPVIVNTKALRVVRLLRLLRGSRSLRIMRILRISRLLRIFMLDRYL